MVGIYDSYNTAIDPATNEAWLTAHLPETMRKRNSYAIVKSNGDTQAGFSGKGVILIHRVINGMYSKEFEIF